MDSATEEKCIQKIEELVQDEDKIVTIASFSSLLKISIQDARRLLSNYVKDQRMLKSSELFVTYILTGSLKSGGTGVLISKESDLKEKKTLFHNVDREVLFSVQKSHQIDFNVLSLVYDVTQPCEEPLIGSVISKNCVKRTLKVKKLPPPPPSTIKGKSSFFLPKSSKNSEIPMKQSSEPESMKLNGTKNTIRKEITQNKGSADIKSNSNSKKPKGGLSGFLSKDSSANSFNAKRDDSIKKENTNIVNALPSEIEEMMEVDFQELDAVEENTKNEENDKVVKIEETKETKSDKKMNTTKSDKKVKNKSKRQRDKSEEKVIKKRKRIVERNDSESDDMFENNEDVIEKSDDEPEPVEPSTPLVARNRIRKAVDKTYMDEEGYMVTKTEYVFESASENEIIAPIKKEEKPKLDKKNSNSSEQDISPPKSIKNKKGKKNNMQNQPTLMNFFKKK